MGSCSLRTSNLKILSLDFSRIKVGGLKPWYDMKTWKARTPLHCKGLVISRSAEKASTVCCDPSSETDSATNIEHGSVETKVSGLTSKRIPNSYEVEYLLREICDTTSIAEFEMKLNGFRLYMTRDLTGKVTSPPPPSFSHVGVNTSIEAPDVDGSVSEPNLAVSQSLPSSGSIQRLLDNAADEGIMIIQSPRVGYFRRSRTIKGKRAPPSCKEKQTVKEGQVLCYIEQLGGEIPVESDVSGEVIKLLREDGEPVGYGDALVAILPSFPGIKKL